MDAPKVEKTIKVDNAQIVSALGEKFGIPDGTYTRWRLEVDNKQETFSLSLFWDDSPPTNQERNEP